LNWKEKGMVFPSKKGEIQPGVAGRKEGKENSIIPSVRQNGTRRGEVSSPLHPQLVEISER
jgi:hypothetical protein